MVIVMAILLASIAFSVYEAAHNVTMFFIWTPLFMVASVSNVMLEIKVKRMKPLPPLPSWEETKVALQPQPLIGNKAFKQILQYAAGFIVFFLLQKFSPISYRLISAVSMVAIAIACVVNVRALGKNDMPANYIWMFTATSVAGAVALILMVAGISLGH